MSIVRLDISPYKTYWFADNIWKICHASKPSRFAQQAEKPEY